MFYITRLKKGSQFFYRIFLKSFDYSNFTFLLGKKGQKLGDDNRIKSGKMPLKNWINQRQIYQNN